MDVRVGLWRRLNAEELMLLKCGVGEDSWESLGLQGDPTNPFWRRLALGFLWKEWCWSWNSSTLANSCEELTHWKRLWCWEGLGAGGEGDDRGWDSWMASRTPWTWVWVNSGSWWWTGRPGVLRFMRFQRVGHDWATELNWWAMMFFCSILYIPKSYLNFFMKQGKLETKKNVDFPPHPQCYYIGLNVHNFLTRNSTCICLTFSTLFFHVFLHSSFSVPFSASLIYLKSSFASDFQSK